MSDLLDRERQVCLGAVLDAVVRHKHMVRSPHDHMKLTINGALDGLMVTLRSLPAAVPNDGECNDRNHVGLDRVIAGARLPDATLGQDAALIAQLLAAVPVVDCAWSGDDEPCPCCSHRGSVSVEDVREVCKFVIDEYTGELEIPDSTDPANVAAKRLLAAVAGKEGK